MSIGNDVNGSPEENQPWLSASRNLSLTLCKRFSKSILINAQQTIRIGVAGVHVSMSAAI